MSDLDSIHARLDKIEHRFDNIEAMLKRILNPVSFNFEQLSIELKAARDRGDMAEAVRLQKMISSIE